MLVFATCYPGLDWVCTEVMVVVRSRNIHGRAQPRWMGDTMALVIVSAPASVLSAVSGCSLLPHSRPLPALGGRGATADLPITIGQVFWNRREHRGSIAGRGAHEPPEGPAASGASRAAQGASRASRRARAATFVERAALQRQLLGQSKRDRLSHDDVAWAFHDEGTSGLRSMGRLSALADRLRAGLQADPARRNAQYRAVLTFAIDRAPRLVDGPDALDRLAGVAMLEWIRPLESYKSKGKSARRCFRALVDHLAVRWPVRPFLYSAFDATAPTDRPYTLVRLFDLLAKGGSVRSAVKARLLPCTMTRRMCHRFMQSTVGNDIPEAVRRAQALELGAGRRLADALAGSPMRWRARRWVARSESRRPSGSR